MTDFKDLTAYPSSDIPPKAIPDARRLMLLKIEPFAQAPAQSDPDGSGERICAHDLFSFFTADIILQKKIFVR